MTEPTQTQPGADAPSESKSKATLSIKIIRKDGSVEEVSDIPVELTKRNP